MKAIMSILNICDDMHASVPVTATAADAIREMLDKKSGAAAVLDENNVVAGIFTERDVLNKLAGKTARAHTTVPLSK